MATRHCEVYPFQALRQRNASAASSYLEFIRETSTSVGLYVLEAGELDPQLPHAEDETYVVVRGAASFLGDGSVHKVEPGSVIFVPAGANHRFVDVTERLEVVVVFAPAEGTNEGRQASDS